MKSISQKLAMYGMTSLNMTNRYLGWVAVDDFAGYMGIALILRIKSWIPARLFPWSTLSLDLYNLTLRYTHVNICDDNKTSHFLLIVD